VTFGSNDMAAITAQYGSSTTFIISDDATALFKKGQRVKLSQGVDGTAQVTVVSAAYSAGPDTTTVTVKQSFVTSHLVSVTRGKLYADRDNEDSNTPEHYHIDDYDGGPIPSAVLTDEQVAELAAVPAVIEGIDADILALQAALGAGSGPLQNNVCALAFESLTTRFAGNNMVIDPVKDTTGIDTVNSDGYYDAVAQAWKNCASGSGLSTMALFDDLTNILQKDRRGTITWFNRTGLYAGIFQTAHGGTDVTIGASGTNTEVDVGCQVTINGETFTILAVSGADNKTVTLDLDAASGPCSNIATLILKNGSLSMNSYGTGTSSGYTLGANASGSGTFTDDMTFVKYETKLTNGDFWTKLEFYSSADPGTVHVKLAKNSSGGSTWDFTEVCTATPGSGAVSIPIVPPIQIPATGDYYMSIHWSGHWYGGLVGGTGAVRYKNGNQTGAGVTSWTSTTEVWNLKGTFVGKIAPSDVCVAIATGDTLLGHKHWSEINSALVNYITTGSSALYLAYCVGFGSAAEKWYSCRSTTTASVAELTSGTWQHRDSGGSLVNSTINDRYGALRQGLDSGSAPSRMTPTEVAAIADANWNDIWSAGTWPVVWAIGLKASIPDIPVLSGILMNYDQSASDISFITIPYEVSDNDPSSAYCVLKILKGEAYTINTDLKAWVSIDNGANWEQITELSVLFSVGSVDYLRGDLVGVTERGDATCLFKITTHNGKSLGIEGIAFGFAW
jgi:hypothetical protein